MSIELHRYGDRALLADVPAGRVWSLTAALRQLVDPAGTEARWTDGVIDIVPAAASVLVEFEPAPGRPERVAQLTRAAYDRAGQGGPTGPGPAITLECHYDGADLDAVAEEIGESVEAVIARHTAGDYLVQFCGFAPGFSYLSGLDPVLQLPRLASPRASVPAGSVAVAGEFTGVYPRSSPGGWRLLGRTEALLFDVDRTPAVLLSPGRRVRFVRT